MAELRSILKINLLRSFYLKTPKVKDSLNEVFRIYCTISWFSILQENATSAFPENVMKFFRATSEADGPKLVSLHRESILAI